MKEGISMLYDYIITNYQKDEPIFLEELPGKSRESVRQEMKKLTDEGKIERLYNGVYYLSYRTILGTKGKISVDKFIQKKFLEVNGEISGYITGIQLANMFGFTTQNPSCYEVCSNEASTKQRKLNVDGRQIIVYKPVVDISKENREKQQQKRYVVNPYFLVNNQGRYYLVCNYDHYDDIANYKLEQIKDIKILETDAKPITKVKGFENGLDIAKYANENIYMFSAKSVSATLKLYDEYAVGIVTDWFGKNVSVYQKGNELFAEVKANEKAIVYWCLQYGDHIELISPMPIRDKIKMEIEKLKNKYNN